MSPKPLDRLDCLRPEHEGCALCEYNDDESDAAVERLLNNVRATLDGWYALWRSRSPLSAGGSFSPLIPPGTDWQAASPLPPSDDEVFAVDMAMALQASLADRRSGWPSAAGSSSPGAGPSGLLSGASSGLSGLSSGALSGLSGSSSTASSALSSQPDMGSLLTPPSSLPSEVIDLTLDDDDDNNGSPPPPRLTANQKGKRRAIDFTHVDFDLTLDDEV